MHKHTDLLAVAKEHDAKLFAGQVKINKAVKDAGHVDVTVGIPVKELNLNGLEEDHDPFNGNLNNRRVAARVAREPEHVSGNTVHKVRLSNREKAAADVAQSLKVNPEPVISSGDELPAIITAAAPTPGSPAANRLTKAQQKAEEAKAKKSNAAPPTWPSAGDTQTS